MYITISERREKMRILINKITVAVICLMIMTSFTGCTIVKKSDIPEKNNNSNTLDTQKIIENSITVGVVELDTYNPLTTNSPTMKNMLGFMFEPLFLADDNFNAENVLASDYAVSPDGKNIRITIKNNIVWHDNSPFTSNDVVYTIKCLLNQETNYSYLTSDIVSATAIDNYTVSVNFKRPLPNPKLLMSFPIIKNGSFKDDFKPIGTGPFYLSYDRLRAYENYHGNKPQLEYIEIMSVPDNEKFNSLFNASVIDIADSDMINMSEYMPRSNAKIYDYCSNEMVYVGFNCESKVFSKCETRKSVSAVIDRREIVSHIYFSRAKAVNYPVNPKFSFYPSNSGNLLKDDGTAEKTMKDAGWKKDKNGTYFYADNVGMTYFSVNILANSDDIQCMKTASAISESMTEMGMKNTLITCPTQEFNDRILYGNYDMYIDKITLLQNNDLSPLLSSGNKLNFSDEETDILLMQTATVSNPEESKAIYDKLLSRIKEIAPIAPVCFLKESLITSAKLKSGVIPYMPLTVARTENWSIQ